MLPIAHMAPLEFNVMPAKAGTHGLAQNHPAPAVGSAFALCASARTL